MLASAPAQTTADSCLMDTQVRALYRPRAVRFALPRLGDARVFALLVAVIAGCGSASIKADAGTDAGTPDVAQDVPQQDAGGDTADAPGDVAPEANGGDTSSDVAPEANGGDAADASGDASDGGRDAGQDVPPQVGIWDLSLWDQCVWGN